jgi:hypothetical protein
VKKFHCGKEMRYIGINFVEGENVDEHWWQCEKCGEFEQGKVDLTEEGRASLHQFVGP